MKNNRTSILVGMIFLVITTTFSAFFVLTTSINVYSLEDLNFIKKIMASKEVLKEKFYEDISEEELYDGAMTGMFAAVGDPYTEYLPAEESSALEEMASGKYEGVGIMVTISNTSLPQILYTLPNSPAEKAGIQSGDIIVSINGESCENMELTRAVELMKIKAGSELKFVIKRNEENININLLTEEIVMASVYSENMDGIGYIQIASFDEATSSEFEKAYNELKNQNIKGLILDLRDNGGGIYEEAVKIAQIIIPKGLIVYTEDKNGVKQEENSTGEGIGIPLVVLINENSASASEILAGAVKDRKCGTLVGKTTYGKGVVQGWFIIGDGTSIKLTIAKYFTPNGICIEGTGIAPDIEVEEGKYLTDLQLNKAKEILK